MNKNQRIVLLIGIFLILLSGLFPYYEGELRIPGDNLKTNLGHFFIFSPPTIKQIRSAFNENYHSDNNFNANIVVSRYFIQIVTIFLFITGLMLFVRDINFKIIRNIRIEIDKKRLKLVLLATLTLFFLIGFVYIIIKSIAENIH